MSTNIGSANELLDTWEALSGGPILLQDRAGPPQRSTRIRAQLSQWRPTRDHRVPRGGRTRGRRLRVVVGALRAYREERIDYIPATNTSSDRHTHTRGPPEAVAVAETRHSNQEAQRPPTPPRRSPPTTFPFWTFWGLPRRSRRDLGEGPNDQDAEMRRNGWVEYDTPTPHHEIQYADPHRRRHFHTCRWFRVDVTHEQTWLEEQTDLVNNLLQNLHARPDEVLPTPSQDFRDDILQISTLNTPPVTSSTDH